MPNNKKELYISVTTSADEFRDVSIDKETGEVHFHTAKNDSTAYTPYLTITLPLWDELVTRVTALRTELPD